MSTSADKKWGRVLICGGTDWPRLGRKEKPGARSEDEQLDYDPDLSTPHILRSLSAIQTTSIHASSSGCHFATIDAHGSAWVFGRNGNSCTGVPATTAELVDENAPKRIWGKDLPGAKDGESLVWAAVGRNHTLLVGSEGQVWSAGANTVGQCGHTAGPDITSFKLITALSKEFVVKASAGVSFSVVLTESGKLFSFGSGEKGQLGNGRTGERIGTGNKTCFDIVSTPVPVKGLEGRQIVQLECGQQHSIALDSEGIVYVWGYNGYCRLGLGNQVDVLIPKAVPQFSSSTMASRAALVSAGPSNSAVVDRGGMYWMAGKWKNSGDGSSGSPYSSFRFMQDIMGCKVTHIGSGGVTHWALAPDEDGTVMTVTWGQNAANGELGLGADEPKSATKPTRNVPLIGIDVFAIAAGQNTTLFLATPGNAKFSDLPRHPAEVDPPAHCIGCGYEDDVSEALQCDKCDSLYHLGCLSPPLTAVPDGEWFCPACIRNPGATVGPLKIIKAAPVPKKSGGALRKDASGANTPRGNGGGAKKPAAKQSYEYESDEEFDAGPRGKGGRGGSEELGYTESESEGDDAAFGAKKRKAGGKSGASSKKRR